MSLNLKKETMINLAEYGKKEDLEYVIRKMKPRCDLPISFYAYAISKTHPDDYYEERSLKQIFVRLLFGTVDGKIPIMECLKESTKGNEKLVKWVLLSLDVCFVGGYFDETIIHTHKLIEGYGEEGCTKLFECAGKQLKERIVEGFHMDYTKYEIAQQLAKEYIATSYIDIKELVSWAFIRCIPLRPESLLKEFVYSDNQRVQQFGIFYLLQSRRGFLSFDDFTNYPCLDEEIAMSAEKCGDDKTSLLESWSESNDYCKRLAVAYFAQSHQSPRTKSLARKLLTDAEIKVRKEALVAFARFKNVSKKRVLKEFYRPKNDVFRTDEQLLMNCFDEKDEILAYLLALPRKEYRKIAMAYVDEREYYGKNAPIITKDIIYMISDEKVRSSFIELLFDEVFDLSNFMLYFEEYSSTLPKTLYIKCFGNVVAAAKVIFGSSCPCLEITDVIGDFYGEKIAMLATREYVFPSSEHDTFEIGKTYTIYTSSVVLESLLFDNL